MKQAVLLFVYVAAVLLLAACSKSDPADAVETFLKAIVAQDKTRALAAVCPEWEAQAAVEFDAFGGVSATLDGVECRKSGDESAFALVSCQGSIAMDYRGEIREMSLENITYRLKQYDGEWKVCGYDQ